MRKLPPLQMLRATSASVSSFTPALGEPVFLTDTGALRVGNGSNPGGIEVTPSISVKGFGAKGDGVSDDTDALNRALDYASSNSKELFFPKGSYLYNGTGHAFSGLRLFLKGEGPEATQVILGSSSRFIDTATAKVALSITGIQFSNGIGAFRSRFSGIDVSYQKLIENCIFIGYTACAIDVNAQDCPYWKIQFNTFRAANSVSTIGIALSRWSDVSLIKGNAFLTNRIHLKMRTSGQCVSVEANDFIQFDAGNGTPRISIWLVPGDTNEGHGCRISGGNKFGLENLQATDYRIVYAPELAAASNGLAMPNLSADTSDYVIGANISENVFCGSGVSSPSVVYSTTPYLRCLVIESNELQYNTPKYLVEYRTAPTVNESAAFTNLLANNVSATAGIAVIPIAPSNGQYTNTFVDDSYSNAGAPGLFYPHTSGANDRTGYVEIFSSRASGFPLAGGSTSQGAITDATGETDAVAVTLPNFSAVNCNLPTGGIVTGSVSWVEVDIKNNGATPLSLVTVRISHSSGPNSFERIVQVPAGWTRFRFPYRFRSSGLAPTFQVINLSGASGTVGVGRIRIYHAREPVTFGRVTFDQLNLSSLPGSPSGLPAGSLWVDAASGNVVKRV